MSVNRIANPRLEQLLPLVALLLGVGVVVQADNPGTAVAAVVGFVVANVVLSKISSRLTAGAAVGLEHAKNGGNVAYLVAVPYLLASPGAFWLLGFLPLARVVTVFHSRVERGLSLVAIAVAAAAGVVVSDGWGAAVAPFAALTAMGLLISIATSLQVETAASLGEANAALADKNINLETVTHNLKSILDHVQAGFFVADKNLRIQAGHSKSCSALLETEQVAGCDMLDLMGVTGTVERDAYEAAVMQILDDELPEELTLDQLPNRFTLASGRVLGLEVALVRDQEGNIDHFMMTLADITMLEAAEAESARARELLRLLECKPAFTAFLADARDRLAECRLADAGPILVRRSLHTIKGNAGFFALREVADHIHDVESRSEITVDDIDRIEAMLCDFVLAHRSVLGIDYSNIDSAAIPVPKSAFSELTSIPKTSDSERVKRWVHLWVAQYQRRPARDIIGPIDNVVNRLATRLGKNVRLELHGIDTPVHEDRLRPALRSLTHLIRNAIDHGIEPPEERGDKGPIATLRIELREAQGAYELIVTDDGRGVDIDRVLAKAVGSGRVDPQEAAKMSEQNKLELIFLDNVSSASSVSMTSGRGVGMSAVKGEVESCGGTIEVDAVRGHRTTFTIRIPRSDGSSVADGGHPTSLSA